MIPGFTAQQDVKSEHNEQHRKLFRLSFCILPNVTTSVPTTTTLQEMFGQIYEGASGSNIERRLYLNVFGNMVYIKLENA